MNDDTIDAKLKHLGGSIDAVREDVKDLKTDVKDLRDEGRSRSEQLARISATVGTHSREIRDVRLLAWKILAFILALHAGASEIIRHLF